MPLTGDRVLHSHNNTKWLSNAASSWCWLVIERKYIRRGCVLLWGRNGFVRCCIRATIARTKFSASEITNSEAKTRPKPNLDSVAIESFHYSPGTEKRAASGKATMCSESFPLVSFLFRIYPKFM